MFFLESAATKMPLRHLELYVRKSKYHDLKDAFKRGHTAHEQSMKNFEDRLNALQEENKFLRGQVEELRQDAVRARKDKDDLIARNQEEMKTLRKQNTELRKNMRALEHDTEEAMDQFEKDYIIFRENAEREVQRLRAKWEETLNKRLKTMALNEQLKIELDNMKTQIAEYEVLQNHATVSSWAAKQYKEIEDEGEVVPLPDPKHHCRAMTCTDVNFEPHERAVWLPPATLSQQGSTPQKLLSKPPWTTLVLSKPLSRA
eukprot:Colp12_sorted_trinity150504_noHs@9337